MCFKIYVTFFPAGRRTGHRSGRPGSLIFAHRYSLLVRFSCRWHGWRGFSLFIVYILHILIAITINVALIIRDQTLQYSLIPKNLFFQIRY